MPVLALRIDIDTYWGCRDGVPALARRLDRLGVPATFFVVTGPDTSGRHMRRVTQKGYLARLRAVGVVGVLRRLRLRSMLYGTLLRGPRVAAGNATLLRGLAASGHEIGVHGFDHARWADHVAKYSRAEILTEWTRAAEAFEEALGFAPRAAAAPNWRVSAEALDAFDALPMEYRSDVRGTAPFYPLVRGRPVKTLQLPVTLPACHELLVSHGITLPQTAPLVLDALNPNAVNVWNLHDWFEGLRAPEVLETVVRGALDRGYRIVTLQEAALGELAKPLSERRSSEVVSRPVPGGVASVSCQV